MPRTTTVIGCRVKSGWAMTVLLAGPAAAPRVLDRRRIELSDPSVADSIQPYHAGFGREQRDERVVARLTNVVARCAERSMTQLLDAYHALGARPARLAIVVGSLVEPASIANQHIRAHAQEGRLFRTVVESAARRHRIKSVIIPERELYATAAKTLGQSPAMLRRRVADLGETIDGPWRAEEKAAAAAAWLLLAGRRAAARA